MVEGRIVGGGWGVPMLTATAVRKSKVDRPQILTTRVHALTADLSELFACNIFSVATFHLRLCPFLPKYLFPDDCWVI